MSAKRTEQAATTQTAATPGSPSSRRLSLGGGNDGMGGPLYKVLSSLFSPFRIITLSSTTFF